MKVFLEDYLREIFIIDKEFNINSIIEFLNQLSVDKYSEMKVYDRIVSLYLIRITINFQDKYKIDYPIKLREVHKQCYATKKQCVAIVRELFEKGNIDDVPGFIDVPIQDFTLDEMIEFKKEEEMMLKGEDPFV